MTGKDGFPGVEAGGRTAVTAAEASAATAKLKPAESASAASERAKSASASPAPDKSVTAKTGGVQAVERAGQLLEVLARHDAGISEMARETGLHKATVHRLIRTLEQTGLVQVTPDGTRYRLGLRLAEFGSQALARLDLREVARPHLRELRDRTRLPVHLAVLDGTEVVYIEKLDSPANLRMASYVGARNPIYCTSLGKAILAALPEDKADQLLAQVPLVPRTANTIVDPGRLALQLAAVREQGYSLDNEENEDGIRCVGAAVRGRDGRVIGAVSVSGPLFSVPEERLAELGQLVAATARRISVAMGWSAAP